MVRVTMTLEFPTLTQADLIALVVANDDAESAVNGEPGIDPEHVEGSDVVALWVSGNFPDVETLLTSQMGE